jgi:hypothetical protein
MAYFRKIVAGLVKYDIDQFVGEVGNMFFDVESGDFRLSDGVTPGGIRVSQGGSGGSYTLPSASASRLGGIKVGDNIIISPDGTISVAPPFSGNYNDLSNKPAQFSGNYNDLSNKPAVVTDISQLTDNSHLLSANPNLDLTAVTTNIVPADNEVQSLGSPTKRWKDLYISGNTIYLGEVTLEVTSGGLHVDGQPLVYDIPLATQTKAGAVKPGTGLTLDADGTLNATGVASYNDLTDKPTIPTKVSELANDLGFLTTWENIAVSYTAPYNPAPGAMWFDLGAETAFIYYNNVWTPLIPLTHTDYVLPVASTAHLGGVKIGDNINIDETGTISVEPTPTVVSQLTNDVNYVTNLEIGNNLGEPSDFLFLYSISK